jgi:hypothetical protein
MIDHDYDAHSGEADKATWRSIGPSLTRAIVDALRPRHKNCDCCLCQQDKRVTAVNCAVLFGGDRVIQDKDITTMIEFIKGAAMGRTVADSLIVMLEELLVLRKKVRDAA